MREIEYCFFTFRENEVVSIVYWAPCRPWDPVEHPEEHPMQVLKLVESFFNSNSTKSVLEHVRIESTCVTRDPANILGQIKKQEELGYHFS